MNAAFVWGWLSAETEATHGNKVVRAGITNLARLQKMGSEVVLPEIRHGKRMWDAAKAFGFVKEVGMGARVGIPFAEILAAINVPGSPIATWFEAKVTADICTKFAEGLDDGKNPLGMPPWERED